VEQKLFLFVVSTLARLKRIKEFKPQVPVV